MRDGKGAINPLGERTPLERAAEMAGRQGGAISLGQLFCAGLSRDGVKHLRRRGLLHPKYRAVYAFGRADLTPRGVMWAAVLAFDGILSHRTAAELRDLRKPFWRIELTRAKQARSTRAVLIHRSPIPSEQITFVAGLPVTTVARTLLDLADVVSERELERTINQAEILRTLDYADLERTLETANGRRGVTVLRNALEAHGCQLTITRGESEEVLLALIRTHRLPMPEMNASVEGFECDFVWRSRRLIVETDGAAFHSTRRSVERDHHRDRVLRDARWRVERFTWHELTHRPGEVTHALRRWLR